MRRLAIIFSANTADISDDILRIVCTDDCFGRLELSKIKKSEYINVHPLWKLYYNLIRM